MDWLLGRRTQQPPSSVPPPPQMMSMQQQPIYEAPDIDTLLTPHDPASLHPLANLDKQTLDYIILEDEQIKSAGALPSKGWTDDLCYGTGTTYLAGLGAGGLWGVIEALQKPRMASTTHATLNPNPTSIGENIASSARAAAASNPINTGTASRQSGKLVLNNILNHVTRRGPFLGNSAGVLALSYNLINASLEAWTPLDQPVTPLVSGFLAGAIFRSTKGPKAMGVAGTLVMGVAAAWMGFKRQILGVSD